MSWVIIVKPITTEQDGGFVADGWRCGPAGRLRRRTSARRHHPNGRGAGFQKGGRSQTRDAARSTTLRVPFRAHFREKPMPAQGGQHRKIRKRTTTRLERKPVFKIHPAAARSRALLESSMYRSEPERVVFPKRRYVANPPRESARNTTSLVSCKMQKRPAVCNPLGLEHAHTSALLLSLTLLAASVCQAAVVRPTIFSDLNASDTSGQQVSSSSSSSSGSLSSPQASSNLGGSAPLIAGK